MNAYNTSDVTSTLCIHAKLFTPFLSVFFDICKVKLGRKIDRYSLLFFSIDYKVSSKVSISKIIINTVNYKKSLQATFEWGREQLDWQTDKSI